MQAFLYNSYCMLRDKQSIQIETFLIRDHSTKIQDIQFQIMQY